MFNDYNLKDVLENVCGLLGLGSVRNTNYVLEASFAGLEGHMRVDLASWKELAPHIKLLLVTKPYSYDGSSLSPPPPPPPLLIAHIHRLLGNALAYGFNYVKS